MRWSDDWPLGQLILARLREFYREPEAVFWVYGFPILMTVALGIAFRENPEPQYRVDVTGPEAAAVAETLEAEKTPKDEPRYVVKERRGRRRPQPAADGQDRPGGDGRRRARYDYEFVPTRPESKLARDEVNDAAAARRPGATTR